MSSNIHLLSTALLDDKLIAKAAQENVTIDVLSFVEVADTVDEKIHGEIKSLSHQVRTIAFTSANAVKVIGEILGDQACNWQIYCIAGATKDSVLKYFNYQAIKGIANNAADLAMCIKQNKEEKIIFFCGDKRLDILPLQLHQSGIKIKEVIVYTTKENPHTVSKQYDGILFFSPSGVNSFFTLNTVSADTALFAIGNTTADAIRGKTGNKLIISNTPLKSDLVTTALNFFNTKTITTH